MSSEYNGNLRGSASCTYKSLCGYNMGNQSPLAGVPSMSCQIIPNWSGRPAYDTLSHGGQAACGGHFKYCGAYPCTPKDRGYHIRPCAFGCGQPDCGTGVRPIPVGPGPVIPPVNPDPIGPGPVRPPVRPPYVGPGPVRPPVNPGPIGPGPVIGGGGSNPYAPGPIIKPVYPGRNPYAPGPIITPNQDIVMPGQPTIGVMPGQPTKRCSWY